MKTRLQRSDRAWPQLKSSKLLQYNFNRQLLKRFIEITEEKKWKRLRFLKGIDF